MERTRKPSSFPDKLITYQNVYDNRIVLTLNEQGMIHDYNIPNIDLFGCRRGASVWGHISELMPEFSLINLMRDGQINPNLRFRCHMGHRFKLIGFGGKIFDVKLFIQVKENQDQRYLRVIIFPCEMGINAIDSNR